MPNRCNGWAGYGLGAVGIFILTAWLPATSLWSDALNLARQTPSAEFMATTKPDTKFVREMQQELAGCPQTSLVNNGGIRAPRQPGSPSFLCWILLTPSLQELLLMQVHLCLNTSIFACDDHLIISNTSIRELMANVPGSDVIKEAIMPGPLTTAYGGTWMTTLNTDLFLSAWTILWERGLHLTKDFTLKLDADTLFQPDRLPNMLAKYTEQERQETFYIESCPWCEVKLIGPVELFSRRAMAVLNENKEMCHRKVPHHNISEDVFIEDCGKLIGMTAKGPRAKFLRPDWKIRNIDPKMCTDGWILLHPLKDDKNMLECYEKSFQTPLADMGIEAR